LTNVDDEFAANDEYFHNYTETSWSDRFNPAGKAKLHSPVLTAPAIPKQIAAPVECRWLQEKLELILHAPQFLERADKDGRAANYKHLKSECDRLTYALRGNNAAERICTLLDKYMSALEDNFENIDIFQLGHCGISLRASVNGAKSILSDANYAELSGLIVSHELFVRQDQVWRDYLNRAEKSSLNRSNVEKYIHIGKKISKLSEAFAPIIDQRISRILYDMQEQLDDLSIDMSVKCYAYLKSLENLMIALIERTLDYASRNAEDFCELFYIGTNELIDEFAEEVRKQVIGKGSGAVATFIVTSTAYTLASIAGYDDVLFSWFTTARDFLETIAKSK
jgi:hypothetical protein